MAKTVQVVLQCSATNVPTVLRQLEALGTTAQQTQNKLSDLKRLLGGLISAAAIRSTVQLADSYARMLNRIRVVTSSNQELYSAMSAIEKMSRETRTSLEANVDLYSRVALNVKQLGISQKDVVRFSTSLNHALILSGVTAREAEWGMVQLSQGMASGALRGDELRAVMEQLPVVSDVLSKHLGVTRGELRLMAFQGKVTTKEIIAAFREAEADLKDRFQKRIATVGEGITVLRSSFTSWLGHIDQTVRGTKTLASAMKLLADNMGIVGPVLTGVASTVGVALLSALLKAKSVVAILSAAMNPWAIAIGAVSAAVLILASNWESCLIALAKVADWLESTFGGAMIKVGDAIDYVIKKRNELAGLDIPKIVETSDYASYVFTQNKLRKLMEDRGLTSIKGELPSGYSTDWLKVNTGPTEKGASNYEAQVRAWIESRKKRTTELSEATEPVAWHPSQEQQEIIKGLQSAMTSYTQSLDIYRQSLSDTKLTEEQHDELLRKMRETASGNMETLKQAYADGIFTEEEYTRRSVELSQKRLKDMTDAASGVQRGLNSIWLEMTDYAAMTEKTVTDAFGGIEDAVVSMATTGKASIKDMVDTVLADLTRLVFRQSLVGLISSVGGAAAGTPTVGANATLNQFDYQVGMAGGGDVYANRAYRVNEQGEELFIPETNGRIVSHNKAAEMTQANVTVITVDSLEQAYAAMRTVKGQRLIVTAKGKVE